MYSNANHHLLPNLFSLTETSTEPSLLLECDSSVKDTLMKHLKVYKIRRKVSLAPCPELAIWTLLPVDKDSSASTPAITANKDDVVLEKDPRTELMGWRLILNHEVNPKDIVSSAEDGDPEDYHRHRYSIGEEMEYYSLIFCICLFRQFRLKRVLPQSPQLRMYSGHTVGGYESIQTLHVNLFSSLHVFCDEFVKYFENPCISVSLVLLYCSTVHYRRSARGCG